MTRSVAPPGALNAAIAAALVALHAIVLFVAPLGGWPTAAALASALVVALATPTLWALIHEAIHGLLFRDRRANAIAGRLLSILFGSPFRALRFAHLRHHRYNRTRLGREEVFDPASTSRAVAAIAHYARITIGLYAGELAILFACWLPPRVLRRLIARLHDDPASDPQAASWLASAVLEHSALAEIRVDAALTLALYATALMLHGERAWIVLVMLAVRGFIASQLDHAPHHGTPLELRDYAWNLAAPAPVRAWLLNFTLHRTHHRHPDLPWTALPFAAESAKTELSFARAVLRQWQGPIAIGALPTGRVQRGQRTRADAANGQP